MKFQGRLVVEILDDGISALVLEDCGFADDNGVIVFPISKGLISDGASIPRPLWSTVGSPLTGKYRRAAFAHDQAYRAKGWTKDLADHMLRAAAIADGCSPMLADLIFEGVQVGGASSYAEDQRVNTPPLVTIDTSQLASTDFRTVQVFPR